MCCLNIVNCSMLSFLLNCKTLHQVTQAMMRHFWKKFSCHTHCIDIIIC